jgi:hypothetical protein
MPKLGMADGELRSEGEGGFAVERAATLEIHLSTDRQGTIRVRVWELDGRILGPLASVTCPKSGTTN